MHIIDLLVWGQEYAH